MSDLVYIVGDMGLAIAEAAVKPDLPFTKFSQLVSRDKRIPPREQSQGGGVAEYAADRDCVGGRLWLPTLRCNNVLGVGLVPLAMTDTRTYVADTPFAYGFQGWDEGAKAYISGLYQYGHLFTMPVISTGINTTPQQLEAVLEQFFASTGLERSEMDENERRSYDDGHSNVIALMKRYSFHQFGAFMFSAFVAKSVGCALRFYGELAL